MKKQIMAMMLAGAMAFSMAGCGSGSSSTSKSTDAGTASTSTAAGSTSATATGSKDAYKISVILKTTSSEHWKYIIAGCNQYMKDHPNVTVDIKGATSETSYDEQQNMIETDLSNSEYDAYVIAPLQSDVVATLISGQTKPIIALDTNIDAPEIISFVGTGNQEAAAMGGETAVQAAKDAGWTEINCIEIAGVQGDATNTARMTGYQEGVEKAGGKFLADEIQYANAVADQAVTSMEAIIQTHPEGVAIVCANNDDMAVAAAKTAQGNEAYAKTIFLGFDGEQSACQSILDGELTMTVAQEGYDMGYLAVDTAVKAVDGEKLEKQIDSGSEVVTKDTAQERLDTLNGYLA